LRAVDALREARTPAAARLTFIIEFIDARNMK